MDPEGCGQTPKNTRLRLILAAKDPASVLAVPGRAFDLAHWPAKPILFGLRFLPGGHRPSGLDCTARRREREYLHESTCRDFGLPDHADG